MLLITSDNSAAFDSPLRLVYDRDREVADFVGERLGWIWQDGFHAIGLYRGPLIVGGVVYSNYVKRPSMVEASIYMEEPNWASRRTLRAFFSYPFQQLHVKRFQTRCKAGAKDIKRFNEKLGFAYEGEAREAWPHGGNAWVFSMLPHECRWIDR